MSNYWDSCELYLDGPKIADNKPLSQCNNCNTSLHLHEYFFVCDSCGSVHHDVFYDASEYCRRANLYKKANYFRMFLWKITGHTYMKKHHYEVIRPLFANRKTKTVSLKDIRDKLKENSLVQKYYRYVPEIYYFLNKIPPNTIKQKDMFDCIEKYKQLVNHEKESQIKLPNSKRFFISYFLAPHYPFLNVFVCQVYPSLYYNTVIKLFQTVPVNFKNKEAYRPLPNIKGA